MAEAEALFLRGTMEGHSDAVTAIATPTDNSDMIVSSSRDKSILVWNLSKEPEKYGVPRRRLTGHSHFVQDVVISSDAQFALSGSWDGDLRLWDLNTSLTTRRFVGHTKDVLSVASTQASPPASTQASPPGECKYTIHPDDANAEAHSNWISCVRFSLSSNNIISFSWNRTLKVWNLQNYKLRNTLVGHEGYVNTVAVSPDGSICASGGKDGVTMLWDLADQGKHLYSLAADSGDIIHALCFNPNKYWLCAATQQCVRIWDLERKNIVANLRPYFTPTKKGHIPYYTSLSWSADGSTLFSGYTDGKIRVWGI